MIASLRPAYQVIRLLGLPAAGANTDRQDFVGFVMRAHATKGMMSRVLAMLSAIEPQPLQAIGISRDTTDGTALQFAPDALLSTAPVQVLQPVQQMAEQTVQESVTQEAVVPKQVKIDLTCHNAQTDLHGLLQSQQLANFGQVLPPGNCHQGLLYCRCC